MNILFVVTYVSGKVSVVEYGSEDKEDVLDKRYVAPNDKLAFVVDRVRLVRDNTVRAANGKMIANLEEWSSDGRGAYEFWTSSREVASTVAATMSFARGLFASRPNEYLPL